MTFSNFTVNTYIVLNEPLEQFDAIAFIWSDPRGFILTSAVVTTLLMGQFCAWLYKIISYNTDKIFKVNAIKQLYYLMFVELHEFGKISATDKAAGLYLPYYFYLYFVILTFNILGLMPFTITFTSSLITNFMIALAVMLPMVLHKFYLSGFLGAIHEFVPHGVPFYFKPFIWIVEAFSSYTKVLSLCTRIFANIFGGHLFLHALAGVVGDVVLTGRPFSIVFIIFCFLLMFALELLVAFLQAFIFIRLITMYRYEMKRHYIYIEAKTYTINSLYKTNLPKYLIYTGYRDYREFDRTKSKKFITFLYKIESQIMSIKEFFVTKVFNIYNEVIFTISFISFNLYEAYSWGVNLFNKYKKLFSK